MFNGKRIDKLRDRLWNIECKLADDNSYCSYTGKYTYKRGLESNVVFLLEENKKLKAIVAELVDYVYKEKK